MKTSRELFLRAMWTRRFWLHTLVWFLFVYLPLAGLGVLGAIQEERHGSHLSGWTIALRFLLATIPAVIVAMVVAYQTSKR